MSYLVIGPIVGVLTVVVLSVLGIAVSRVFGGDVVSATSQIYDAAGVVLLVTILARLESIGKTKPQ